MDRVRVWLSSIGLEQYGEVFENQGWDDMDTVCTMCQSDIQTCVSKPGHVRKLSIAIKHLNDEKQDFCETNVENPIAFVSEPVVEINLVKDTLTLNIEDNNVILNEKTDESITEIKLPTQSKDKLVEINSPHEGNNPDNMKEEQEHEIEKSLISYDATIIPAIDKNTSAQHTLSSSLNECNVKDQPTKACGRGSPKESARIKTYVPTIGEDSDTDEEDISSDEESRDTRHTLVHLPTSNAMATGGQPMVGQLMTVSSSTASVSKATIVKDSKNVTIAEKVEIHNIRQDGDASYDNFKDQIQTVFENYKRKSHLYVKTQAYQEVIDVLEDRNWVVISGNPGDGKSTMAHHVLLDHSERGYTPVVVSSVEDWKAIVEGKGKHSHKQIVMIDDMFGALSVDERKLNEWMSLLGLMGKVVEERSGDLKVVCTTRKYILSQIATKVGRFKEFGRLFLVDLTKNENALLLKEKTDMFHKYFKHYNIELSVTVLFSLLLVDSSYGFYGFPLCVEMFCTNARLREKENAFFVTPILFLEKEVQYLYEFEQEKYCALVLCLLSEGNKIDASSLEDLASINPNLLPNAFKLANLNADTRIQNIYNAFKILNNVFIEEIEQDVYVFKHDSIQEIVSIIVTKSQPKNAIKFLDVYFLCETVKCSGYKPLPIEDVVVLPCSCTATLAERITEELQTGVYSVACKCQAWDDPNFLDIWLRYVTKIEPDSSVSCSLLSILKKRFEQDELSAGLISFLLLNKKENAVSAILKATESKAFLQSAEGIYELSVALVFACFAQCSLDVLRLLIDNGADIDFEYGGGKNYGNWIVIEQCLTIEEMSLECFCTPLVCSVTKNSINHIRLLLELGASVFKMSRSGKSILSVAVDTGSLETVQCILEHIKSLGARQPHYCRGKYTELQMLKGEEYVRYFCSLRRKSVGTIGNNRIDLTLYTDTYIVHPIHTAHSSNILERLNAECNNLHEPVYVCTHFPWVMCTDKMPVLIFMFITGRVLENCIVHTLIKHGADVNNRFRNQTLLHVLVQNHTVACPCWGSCFLLECLIKHGLDLNAQDDDGQTPLNMLLLDNTSESACIELAEWLVTAGADTNIPDKLGRIPLLNALFNFPSVNLVRKLITTTTIENAFDNDGRNSFHYLAKCDSLSFEEVTTCKEIITLLLTENVDINHLDNAGRSPITYADNSMMKLFLANGANPNVLDENGTNLVMHFICYETSTLLANIYVLLESGLDITSKDIRHRNVLHYIADAMYDDQEKQNVLQLCLKHQCQINAPDKDGVTPLMVAVENNRCSEPFFRYLIENGASISDVDNMGMSVLNHCCNSSVKDRVKERIANAIIEHRDFISIDEMTIALSSQIGTALLSKLCNKIKGNLSCNMAVDIFKNVLTIDRDETWKISVIEMLIEKYDRASLKSLLQADFKMRVILLKYPLCLDLFFKEGFISSSLYSDGISAEHLPETDNDTAVVLDILAKNQVNINILGLSLNEFPQILFAKGRLRTLSTLLKFNRNKKILNTDADGNTVLHYLSATDNDDRELVDVLNEVIQTITYKDVHNNEGLTPLHLACQQKELKPSFISRLIKCSENVNAIDIEGRSAMHHLVKRSSINTEKLNAELVWLILDLLSHNARSDKQDKSGKTPLMCLLENTLAVELQATVEVLILNTVDATTCDKEGNSILHYLVRSTLNDDVICDFADMLVQKGASTNTVNKYKMMPIHYCLQGRSLKVFHSLRKWIAHDKNKTLNCVLHLIASNKEVENVSEECIDIIKHGYLDVNTYVDITGVTLLSHCCRCFRTGFQHSVQALLEHGANPNLSDILGYTSIHRLLFSAELIAASILKCTCFYENFESEISFQARMSMPWEWPVPGFFKWFSRYLDSCDFTSEKHSVVLKLVNTALKILYLLLSNKADPNQMDVQGKSPLHYCVESPVMDGFTCPAMEMLIAYGADVNLEDYHGRTPLMLCAQYARTKHRRMNILIMAGANLMAVDYQGNSVADYTKRSFIKLHYCHAQEHSATESRAFVKKILSEAKQKWGGVLEVEDYVTYLR